MEVSLAIEHGLRDGHVTDNLHPYLTRSEGVQLAGHAFDQDVAKLNCCAT